MPTALIVDNDPRILRELRVSFHERGYEVVTATEGRDALRAATHAMPQVIVLDNELSDVDGRELVVALRGLTTAPIILLSSHADSEEVVRALDAGADDYLAKPFGVEELLARTRAALRRAAAEAGRAGGIIDAGSFTVDLDARKVWRDGAEVHLTPTEWGMLEILIRHEGQLVTQQHLLAALWGPKHHTDTHYLRVYIGQLRRKLEPRPANPRHLITEPNVGYRFHTYRADGPPPR